MVRFATEMRSPESRPGHRPGRTFEEELNLRYLSPGAFTVLGPEDRGLPPEPPQAPPVYRLSPNARRHRNQAFSIIAEPLSGRSRSPSPTSGRVSPFRGRGFNPTGSRHTSPAPSPPPGERIINNQYPINIVNRPTNVSRKSQIPQLKRREMATILFTEESEGSPKYNRKNATNLKPQLSKSLNNIGPKNNPFKPPTNPTARRHPGISSKGGGQGFSRLSPIIGSSPEPSSDNKSQSSPTSRIPKSKSTPSSRKSSPNRELSSEYRDSSREDTPDYNGNKEGSSSRKAGSSRDHSPNYIKGSSSRNHSPSGRKDERKGRYSPEFLDHRGKPRQREPEYIDYKGKIRSRANSPEYQSESQSTSRGKTSSSREGSPEYHGGSRGKISSREGSPEYHKGTRGKATSREGSPEHHRSSRGKVSSSREHSPSRGKHASSRPHSPSRGKHVSTREHSPEYHRNAKGRDHSPSRGKHSEHSPEHHRKTSPSRKYSSSREQSPEHHRGKAGSSREHSPEYHSRGKHHSSSGKHHHKSDIRSPSQEHHRRKKPNESRESSPEYRDSKTHINTSRHQSPGNVKSPHNRSRVNSRAGSRNASRNPSRDASPSSSKPPFSPTRIPIRNYKNVQSKVNSYAKTHTTTTKSKVPSKPQESKSRAGLSRTDSVSKNVSKTQPGKFGGSGSNLSRASGSNTNLNKTSGMKSSSSQNNLNRAGVRTPTTTTGNNNNNKKTSNTSVKGVSKGKDGNGNIDDGDEVNGNSKINSASKASTKTINNNQKGGKVNVKPAVSSKAKTNEPLKKVESSAKLDLPPSTNTVVSSTTSTVTQPLKIDAKLEAANGGDAEKPKMKETPMYMDEDSQTLLKDHNMSKLTPAASAIITLSNENNSVNAALPNVETVTTTNRIDTASQNVNNSVSNISNKFNNTNPMGVENNVKNNINKLISPDDSFGAKVNSYENSANDRIKEARTMVASDVKPIRITVQEKPNDVEVQSGNVRFPPNITNGVASGPGGAPPQGENGNSQPEPPKSRCQMFMERCKNKMPCSCCKPKEKTVEDVAAKEEKETRGCFSCCKKKKKVEVEQVIVSSPEDVENAKKTFMERLKCCKSNKVGDSTTGCCGRGKRKESWQDRRDSILSAPMPISKGTKCKNFLKMIFCCGCACACCKKKTQPPKMLEETSASRRASMLSKKKSLTPTVLPPEEPKNKLDTSLVEYTSTMKAAIPVLPIALAYICLFFNIFAPGTGTVFSGLFCLCMGIPRFSQRDGPKPRFGAFIINIIIGCGQLFTVLFCLVGWGWSIWWGVIMVKIAKKYKKLKKIEERLQAQEKAAADAAAEEKRKDAEKGRS